MTQLTLFANSETTGANSCPVKTVSPDPSTPASCHGHLVSDQCHPSHPSHTSPPSPFHSTLHHLPLEQRHQIIAWIQKHTYAETIDLIQKNFGVTVGHSALGRFHASTALLNHLEETPDTAAAADELLQHLAHHQHKFTDATLRVLEQTAFKLSLTVRENVTHLDQLNRVSTILCRQRNTSVRERHAQVQERKCDLRHEELALKKDVSDRTLALREKTLDFQREKEANRAVLNSKLKTQNSKLGLRPLGHYIDEQGRECDHLGPLAVDWDDVEQRVCKQFNITPEEIKRRRELFEKLYNDDGTLKNPDEPLYSNLYPQPQPSADDLNSSAPNSLTGGTRSPSPTSTSRDASEEIHATPADQKPPVSPLPAGDEGQGEGFRAEPNDAHPADRNAQNNQDPQDSPLPSVPSAPLWLTPPPITVDPATLAAIVDRYTVSRMREYIAHNQRYTPWPHRHSPPEYITQFRHCPCGQQCPCPVHESEEFGHFPERFWRITPTNLDYAANLRARNLPFRFPQEFIA